MRFLLSVYGLVQLLEPDIIYMKTEVIIVKCIYCNSEDLTVSDIIPYALTGAKLRREFVCKKHNAFTNDNYEKIMINKLAMYRNLLGLATRSGKPVSFSADLEIDGYKIENESISDKASIMSGKRVFSTVNEKGQKVVLGDKTKLLKINSATEEQIKDISLGNISISRIDDLRDLFISNEALHSVAKIAYEWHCFMNNIEEYNEKEYSEIVDYILSPESSADLVEVVVDAGMWAVYDNYSTTGANFLFEYDDTDGKTYVIFGLWNIMLYKVKICEATTKKETEYTLRIAYLYHIDGRKTQDVFITPKSLHIVGVEPLTGITHLLSDIKTRMSKIGERDLSREYLKINIEKIKKLLSRYKSGQITISELLDYEADDRITTFYILELIWTNKSEYLTNETFTANMIKLLNTNDRFIVTQEKRKEIIEHYVKMDNDSTFIDLIEKSIKFFEENCQN